MTPEMRLALALRAAGLVHWNGRERLDPDEADAARLMRLGVTLDPRRLAPNAPCCCEVIS